MMHEGMISTGSACTSGVLGRYWISSIRLLRSTTSPSVMAKPRPTPSLASLERSAGKPFCWRHSSSAMPMPRTSVWPPLRHAACNACGLLQSQLLGEARSSNWRP